MHGVLPYLCNKGKSIHIITIIKMLIIHKALFKVLYIFNLIFQIFL